MHWRQRESKCPFIANVDASTDTVLVMSEHTHFVDAGKRVAEVITKEAVSNAATNDNMKSRNAILNLAQNLDRARPSVLCHMASKTSLSRKIRYERCEAQARPP